MSITLKGGDQHRVENLNTAISLVDFVEKAGREGYRVLVTAPNRRGFQNVILIDSEMIEVHLRSAARGEATPGIPGEVASYRLQGTQVYPTGSRSLAFFDV